MALSAAFLLLLCAALPVFADPITPHEEEDGYFEEEWDTGGEDYTDSPDESYDENSGYEGGTEDGNTPSDESEPSASSAPSSSSSSSSASSAAPKASASPAPAGTVSGTEDDSPEYVVFGKMGSKSNDIAGTMNMAAIAFIAVGVVGIICVIVWSSATRDIRRSPDEEVYETVGQAQRAQNSRQPQRRQNPYIYEDNYNRNPKSAQPQRPQAGQQRQEAQQRRPEPSARAQAAARPAAPQRKTVEQAPRPRASQPRAAEPAPRQVQNKKMPSKAHEFDTQDILNEFLKDRKK